MDESKEKLRNWRKSLLLASIAVASTIAFVAAPSVASPVNQDTRTYAASAVTATVVSKQSLNFTAVIHDSARNDVTLSAPAYTTTTSMVNAGSGRSVNGHTVQVTEADVTKRSDGREYTYLKVYDRTTKKTYWIDQRAIYATISSSATNNYAAVIEDSTRNDGVFISGPALTSSSTMSANYRGKNYTGDKVTVVATDVTSRGDGSRCTYVKVNDSTKGDSYWIDSRAISTSTFDTITAKQTGLSKAATISKNRSDEVYTSGPAYTSTASSTAAGTTSSLGYQGDSVTVSEIDTTSRTSGGTYQYAKVTDSTKGKSYWVDARSISYTAVYDKIESQTAVTTEYAQILDGSDWLETAGPANTSSSTTKSLGKASTYAGDYAEVKEIATTKGSSGTVRNYAEIYIPAAGKTYWVNDHSLSISKYATITSSTTASGTYKIDETGRSDGTYSDGPALTSSSTLVSAANASTYDGDTITLLKKDVTTRANGSSYTYDEVQDTTKDKTYWIDSGAVAAVSSYDKIESQTAVTTEYAQILDGSDWLETAGPADTSSSTTKSLGTASTYAGDFAQVEETATTKDSSGTVRNYAEVYIPAAGKTYWVNDNSLSISKYATITSSTTVSVTYKVADYARNDTIYSGPALTSSSTLYGSTTGRTYDGDTVTVEKESVEKRANGSSYTYAEVYDQTKKVTYWIDMRGLALPTENGYDESAYQAGISNGSVSGSFVIVKATESNYYVNPDLASQVASTVKAGKQLGLYCYANTGDAVTEAKYFVNEIKPYLSDHPILVLDWEGAAMSQGTTWAKEWLDEVYALTGVKPMIYMSKSVTNEYNWTAVANAGYKLWAAQYATTASTGYESDPWTSSTTFGAWGSTPTIYQYTDNGSLAGYGSALDLDLFYGDFEDWDELAGLAY